MRRHNSVVAPVYPVAKNCTFAGIEEKLAVFGKIVWNNSITKRFCRCDSHFFTFLYFSRARILLFYYLTVATHFLSRACDAASSIRAATSFGLER